MCRFCERAGKTVKKITVNKYEVTSTTYDKVFGVVPTGTKVTKRQPCMKLEMDKGWEAVPMPVEFKFCPHCGRNIKGE